MRKGVLGCAALLAVLGGTAAPAAAGPLPPAVPGPCGEPAFEQTFFDWGDRHYYSLAPGGDFEAGAAGWTLAGGAALVDDGGDTVVSAPPGATFTSPPLCVAEGYTHARMFDRSGSAEGKQARLEVAVHHGAGVAGDGEVTRNLRASAEWDATKRFSLDSEGFELDPGTATGTITLEFTVVGAETFVADDVYIDPSRRN